MRKQTGYLLLIGLVGSIISPQHSLAIADGNFDPTWAGAGRIVFPGDYKASSSDSELQQIIVENNGNLLLVGPTSTFMSNTIYTDTNGWLGELFPSGLVVPTFGASDGYGIITECQLGLSCGNGSNGYFTADALQTDGKILVLTASDLLIRTSAQAHQLDTSGVVGSNGYVSSIFQINNAQGKVFGNAVIVQPDGKVLMAGGGYYDLATNTNINFGIARLNTDLSLDTSFNAVTDGSDVTFAGGQLIGFDLGGNNIDQANAVSLLADGKIVLVGTAATATASSYALAVARLNPDGSMDTSFGSGTGKSAVQWESGKLNYYFTQQAVAIDRAGRIVVALTGTLSALPVVGMLVVRFNSNGTLDASFDAGGFSFNEYSTVCTNEMALALSLDSAGRIVVGGTCDTEIGIERLRGDTGALDTSFGINGFSHGRYDDTSDLDGVNSLVFDQGGHLVIGGQSAPPGSGEAAVGRLTYDLIFTNNFETAPLGCLRPDCN